MGAGHRRSGISKCPKRMKRRSDANPTAGNMRHRGGRRKGERTAFQNSAIGSRARMNLKGEEGGHKDGDQGRKGGQAPGEF